MKLNKNESNENGNKVDVAKLYSSLCCRVKFTDFIIQAAEDRIRYKMFFFSEH